MFAGLGRAGLWNSLVWGWDCVVVAIVEEISGLGVKICMREGKIWWYRSEECCALHTGRSGGFSAGC